jgi:uncharacterized protein (DUF1800 family)
VGRRDQRARHADRGARAAGPDWTPVTVTASDPQALEQGLDAAVFTVSRGAASAGAQTVAYTVNGTATPGVDYRALTGTVTIPAGATSATVVLMPVDDTLAEPTETVTISLVPGNGTSVGAPASATVSLQDNDTVVVPDSDIDASRFLTQATFGPTPASVQQVRTMGYDPWIAAQASVPASSFLGFIDQVNAEDLSEDDLQEAWFTYATNAPDQLRLRVANALIEILVLSSANGVEGIAEAQAAYMDILQRNAFGNYRQLLEDVTLNPGMGQYLSHLKNDKPGPGHNPDENYGREVLQLFSIGLNRLNQDGTLQRDGQGNPLPTYTQDIVKDFAHVFTGWTYAHDGSANFYDADENWRDPMRGIQSHHSTKAKTLLNGLVVPAGQPMAEDLRQALDNIFTHPNVGPFISRQLIQRLVTSNPSPSYIARVAGVFANNGSGCPRRSLRHRPGHPARPRGPFADDGARPDLRAPQGADDPLRPGAARVPGAGGVGQVPHHAARGHRRPGAVPLVERLQLLLAELPQARHAGQPRPLLARVPDPDRAVGDRVVEHGAARRLRRLRLRHRSTDARPVVAGRALRHPPVLVDSLNTLLFNGMMSADLRNIIVEAVESIPADELEHRAQLAVSLAVTSAEFVVQK